MADVETLRVLADPLRLAIVNHLMEGAARDPKIRSAKELAKELGQPQTKLYRHLKQLCAAGLVVVAETRLVSGIVEARYRTGQQSLRIAESILGGEAPVDDILRALAVIMDRHREELFTAIRTGRVPLHPASAESGPVTPTLALLNATIPLDRAEAFAHRLTAVVEEFASLDSDPDGVPVNMLIAYHAVDRPQ